MRKVFCVAWRAIGARSCGNCTRSRHVPRDGNRDRHNADTTVEILLRCAAREAAINRPPLGEDAMRFVFSAALLWLAATLPATAQPAPSADALKDLAPTGKLRAAINFGNSVLAQKGTDGAPQGITADLSRELAKRLGVPVAFVTLRGGRQGVRGRQGRRVGHRLHRDRAGARRRHRLHRALCDHRRHLHGAAGFAAEGSGRRRQAGHQDRGRGRLGLRPLSDAHAEEGAHSCAPRSAAARR